MMPRKPAGERTLTGSERVARHRQRQTQQIDMLRMALGYIIAARTIREAREIAKGALTTARNSRASEAP